MGLSKKDIWTTADGQKIPIKKLADSHLVNILAFLRRQAEVLRFKAALPLLGYLNSDPPDGAYMAASLEVSALAELEDDEVLSVEVPQWKTLLAEARRRGLEPAAEADE